MSRPGTVVLEWADGEHVFRLGYGQLEELQDKTDCGPITLLDRLRNGGWRAGDIRETIRLGLIGGGAKPGDALSLVRRYVEGYETSLLDNAPIASAILLSALAATKDQLEALGEAKAEQAATETTAATGVSPSPPSEPISAPSDTAPSISTSSASSKRSRSSKRGTASRAGKSESPR